jgi:hypothetical protein
VSADLVTWLRAQLDEDEQVARAASTGGRWSYSDGGSVGAWMLYDEEWQIGSLKTYRHETYDYSKRMPVARDPRYVDADANGSHIARWDPARVLAEVDAKRQLLNEAASWAKDDRPGESSCGDTTLSLLALPYADRPGYREEWRP